MFYDLLSFKKMHFMLKTGILYHLSHQGSFLGNSAGKESACNARRPGLIPGLGRSPGEGEQLPTPVFWPGEFHGQRSLAGYSPWGHKESDTTERLGTAHINKTVLNLLFTF